jgi:hypothetical protein
LAVGGMAIMAIAGHTAYTPSPQAATSTTGATGSARSPLIVMAGETSRCRAADAMCR